MNLPTSERSTPYHFAGRHEEFRIIGQKLRDAQRVIEQRGYYSPFFLVQGVPGIGKTAFLSMLPKELRECGFDIVHLDLDSPNDVANERGLIRETIRSLGNPETLLAGIKQTTTASSIEAGGSLFGVVEGKGGQVETHFHEPQGVYRYWLLDHADAFKNKLLLITIDEVQEIAPNNGAFFLGFQKGLVELGAPILFCMAGLPIAPEILATHLKIYRPESGLKLEALDDAASREGFSTGVVEYLCQMHGMTAGESMRLVKSHFSEQALNTVIETCVGFPAHLQTAVQCMGEHLYENPDKRLTPEEILQAIDAPKRAYYERVLSTMRPYTTRQIHSVLQEIQAAKTIVVDDLLVLCRTKDIGRPEHFVEISLKRGLFTTGEKSDEIKLGIPSLKAHIDFKVR